MGGPTYLLVNGGGSGGTVVLAASNTFSGSTTIAAGTLQLGDGLSGLGAVTGNITDNATLAFRDATLSESNLRRNDQRQRQPGHERPRYGRPFEQQRLHGHDDG